jgi:hypothetical protein
VNSTYTPLFPPPSTAYLNEMLDFKSPDLNKLNSYQHVITKFKLTLKLCYRQWLVIFVVVVVVVAFLPQMAVIIAVLVKDCGIF